MSLSNLQKEIKKAANKSHAQILSRFFKTGKGEYGEGDIFLGIKVPIMRKIAKEFTHLTFQDIQKLLNSKIHEERFIALVILITQFNKTPELEKDSFYTFYLNNTHNINNWDLVDLSADRILGNYLENKDHSILKKLALSDMLWERRIAIMATFYFIKYGSFNTTLEIADILIQDQHDLIHKAVGWMIREVGKKDIVTAQTFLKMRYKTMPRTMLRYAIERYPEKLRQDYLKGRV